MGGERTLAPFHSRAALGGCHDIKLSWCPICRRRTSYARKRYRARNSADLRGESRDRRCSLTAIIAFRALSAPVVKRAVGKPGEGATASEGTERLFRVARRAVRWPGQLFDIARRPINNDSRAARNCARLGDGTDKGARRMIVARTAMPRAMHGWRGRGLLSFGWRRWRFCAMWIPRSRSWLRI